MPAPFGTVPSAAAEASLQCMVLQFVLVLARRVPHGKHGGRLHHRCCRCHEHGRRTTSPPPGPPARHARNLLVVLTRTVAAASDASSDSGTKSATPASCFSATTGRDRKHCFTVNEKERKKKRGIRGDGAVPEREKPANLCFAQLTKSSPSQYRKRKNHRECR